MCIYVCKTLKLSKDKFPNLELTVSFQSIINMVGVNVSATFFFLGTVDLDESKSFNKYIQTSSTLECTFLFVFLTY